MIEIEPYRALWKREEQDNKELREIIEYKEQKIERLNKEREIDIKYNKYLQKELAKANSIIKEVREYIEKSKSKLPLGINDFTCEMVYSDEVVLANELLKILDKEEE